MIHNTDEFNASTNTAQIVNNTIINTTEIVKGYPYDDKTQKSLIMSKADSFHYPQNYDQNLIALTDNITKQVKGLYYPFSNPLKSNDLFSVGIYLHTLDNGVEYEETNASMLFLEVNGKYIELKKNTDYYWEGNVTTFVGETLHIKAGYKDYFESGTTTEGDFVIPENYKDAVFPSILVDIDKSVSNVM